MTLLPLNKNHGLRRDFCCPKKYRLVGFDQRANALGAKHFANGFAAFSHTHRLQVGAEGTPGGLL
jgi:hypothetical protein